MFFHTPTAENTIVIRQMTYLGKIVRGPTNHPPRQMLTASSANPRPKRGVLTTNKKALVCSLYTLLPKERAEIITTRKKTTGKHTTKTCSTRMRNSSYGSRSQITNSYGLGT